MKKLITSLLIISVVILNINYDVYASDVGYTTDTYVGLLKNVVDIFVDSASPTEEQTINAINGLLESGGFISNIAQPSVQVSERIIKYMASQFEAQQNTATMQENIACIKEYLQGGINTSGDSVQISNDIRQALVNTAKYYSEDSMIYGYSFTLQEISSRISYSQVYTALQNYIDETSDVMGKVYVVRLNGLGTQVFSLDQSYRETEEIYLKVGTVGNGANYRYTSGEVFSLKTNTYPNLTGVEYNNSTQSFEPMNSQIGSTRPYILLDNISRSVTVPTQTIYLVSRNARIPVRIFNHIPTVSEYLYQPYYYNTDTWNDFSSSSGDFTYDTSSINTVNYGGVTNYIDSFNTTNGYPPSVTKIEKDIKQSDEENKQNSGGGSGSGGSGSGGSGDGGLDLGFLGTLGTLIGKLITAVGSFLTGIVEGLVNAITNILESLTTLITELVENIPLVFNDFLGAFLSWMPVELRALISFSIVAMIIVGVIKLIRGA